MSGPADLFAEVVRTFGPHRAADFSAALRCGDFRVVRSGTVEAVGFALPGGCEVWTTSVAAVALARMAEAVAAFRAEDAACGGRANIAPVEPAFPTDARGVPIGPCRVCGGRSFWKPAGEAPDAPGWSCRGCSPPPEKLEPTHSCTVPPPVPDPGLPARAAAAVDPRHADDPGEATLRGEHDPDADPAIVEAERIAEAYRAARAAGDHAAAAACVVRLARVLAPGCEHFAGALHRAEDILALVHVNPRRGFAELRQAVAAIRRFAAEVSA